MQQWIRHGNIFNEHHAQVPVVDVCDGYWRIYYSQRIDGKSVPYYIDVDPNNPANILRRSPTSLLELGMLGRFDWAGIMPTDIINVGSKKYMYYIGWSVRKDVPYHNTLGLAVSEDGGQSWQKFSQGPVLATSYKEPGFIGSMCILAVDNIYHMYYLSCRDWIVVNNHPEPIYDIKIATSSNAIDWEPTNTTAISLDALDGGISKPSIVYVNRQYHMWYSVRGKADYRTNATHSYRIRHAVSDNLITWTKTNQYGLDMDESSEWERIMVEYPEVLMHQGKLHMFYNGDGFGRTGIGYATMDIADLMQL